MLSFFWIFLLVTGCQKERLQIPLTELSAPVQTDINGLVAWENGHWVAVGGTRWMKGLVLHTADSGRHWSVDSVADGDITRLSAQGGTLAASLFATGVLMSIDSGRTWQKQSFPQNEALHGLAQSSEGNLAVVGGINYHSGCVYHFPGPLMSSDWILDSMTQELYDIAYLAPQTLVAVGYGIAMRSEDGGRNWQPTDVRAGDMYRGLHFPTERVGYAVGFYGSIIKTSDGGLTWHCLRNSDDWFVSDERFRDVFFLDEQKGYIVGENGTFWTTDDGGRSWAIVEGIPGDIHLYSVAVSDGVGYLTGSRGKIYIFVP
jgi:photosystem II stability/assembly factor-like uncharacterized protein